MKLLFAIILITISTVNLVNAQEVRFPRTPNLEHTPGKLCTTNDKVRYPEKINYCERNVDVYMKEDVIRIYDQELGFRIKTMSRGEFKIDHLIPLCAGGANDELNLWPQHRSVYKITDPIEPLVCQKMAEGKLSQKDAVEMIIYAKTHLDEVSIIMKKLISLK
jgi:hypothetical protein